MSGSDQNYYFVPNGVYPPGYESWAHNWAQNQALGFQAATTVDSHIRNTPSYTHNTSYNVHMHTPPLNTNVSYPTGSPQGRTTENQGSNNRPPTHYPPPQQHNYYNRPYNNHTPNRYNWGQPAPYTRHKDYTGNSPHGNYNHPRNYKRNRDCEAIDHQKKTKMKKKKPLSEATPKQKDWTPDEAIRALEVEKQHNKMFKNHSLIIKFPDLEVNKKIVSNFHSTIENVHFQQPSTARFCFVTLQKDADADKVIQELNKIKFGEGHLSVEYKKDRDEEQVLSPEDIDPLTLYVGNLAQEVTKEDMTRTFPKCKRIDIGYAKKMKYTRYAFVSFRKVDEAIEAFRKNWNQEMYSKSMIVRFRRLKGTVGMPGEAKQQNPPRLRPESTSTNQDDSVAPSPDPEFPSIIGDAYHKSLQDRNPDYYYEDDSTIDSKANIFGGNLESTICNEILSPPYEDMDIEIRHIPIKDEPLFDVPSPLPPLPPEPEPDDVKPDIKDMLPLQCTPGPEEIMRKVKPNIEIKKEIRSIPEESSVNGDNINAASSASSSQFASSLKPGFFANVQVKKEPESAIEYYERRDPETLAELEYNHMWHKEKLGIEGFS